MQIIQNFITNNRCYTSQVKRDKIGYMQHSTAMPGTKASHFMSSWNKKSASVCAEFVIDDTGIYQLLPIGIKSWHCGASGNNTHVACEVCEPDETRLIDINWYVLKRNGANNTAWAVKRCQQELIEWGYDPNGVDGVFGPGMQTAVKQFQQDNGLDVDGCVGPATKAKMATRAGSLMKFNPDDIKEYFEDVYTKAVWLAGYVLKELGIKDVTDTNVVSHAEGYQLGIASNHADVGHWWPLHGKTMDDFRHDVKEYMATGVLPFEKKSDMPQEPSKHEPKPAPSDWAKAAWDKACGKGIFDGTGPQEVVTREMLAVVLDKLGLID